MLGKFDICYTMHCVYLPVEFFHSFDRLLLRDLTSCMNPQPAFGKKENTEIIVTSLKLIIHNLPTHINKQAQYKHKFGSLSMTETIDPQRQ